MGEGGEVDRIMLDGQIIRVIFCCFHNLLITGNKIDKILKMHFHPYYEHCGRISFKMFRIFELILTSVYVWSESINKCLSNFTLVFLIL